MWLILREMSRDFCEIGEKAAGKEEKRPVSGRTSVGLCLAQPRQNFGMTVVELGAQRVELYETLRDYTNA